MNKKRPRKTVTISDLDILFIASMIACIVVSNL